jgi:hypothetical protein
VPKFGAKKVPLSGHYSLDLGQIRKEISRKSDFLQLQEGSWSQNHNKLVTTPQTKNTLLWPLRGELDVFKKKCFIAKLMAIAKYFLLMGWNDAIPFRW